MSVEIRERHRQRAQQAQATPGARSVPAVGHRTPARGSSTAWMDKHRLVFAASNYGLWNSIPGVLRPRLAARPRLVSRSLQHPHQALQQRRRLLGRVQIADAHLHAPDVAEQCARRVIKSAVCCLPPVVWRLAQCRHCSSAAPLQTQLPRHCFPCRPRQSEWYSGRASRGRACHL